jgi:L-lactate dehydrogenase complex protein LldG
MANQNGIDSLQMFTSKAEAVSCVVSQAASMSQVFDYVVDVCDKREACQLLIPGCEEALSQKAAGLCDAKRAKVVAAPNLSKRDFGFLKKKCEEKGILCIDEGMRDREHLAGIDIGLAVCQVGIADTGTVVLDSDSEEVRLSSMVSEVFVAVVDRKDIFADAFAAEKAVNRLILKNSSYTAFITGASRTSDIERVLALGVHGPLEMHVVILDKKNKKAGA